MATNKGFSFHVARDEMDSFLFGTCRCGETIIRARVKKTQKDQAFNPQPVGGSEINRIYSVHQCAGRQDE